MNDTSQELVNAAHDAVLARRLRTIAPSPEEIAKVTTAAVLQKLSDLMDEAESEHVDDWPDAGDLELLARDIQESL